MKAQRILQYKVRNGHYSSFRVSIPIEMINHLGCRDDKVQKVQLELRPDDTIVMTLLKSKTDAQCYRSPIEPSQMPIAGVVAPLRDKSNHMSNICNVDDDDVKPADGVTVPVVKDDVLSTGVIPTVASRQTILDDVKNDDVYIKTLPEQSITADDKMTRTTAANAKTREESPTDTKKITVKPETISKYKDTFNFDDYTLTVYECDDNLSD